MIKVDFEGLVSTLASNVDKVSLLAPPTDDICRVYKTDKNSTNFAYSLMSSLIDQNRDFPEILIGDDVYKDGEKVFEEREKYLIMLSDADLEFNNPLVKTCRNVATAMLMPLFKDARLSKINPKTGKTFWGELAMAVINDKWSNKLPGYDFVVKEDENGDTVITYEKIA